MFRHLDLFSGIGGFALAASWVWPDHEVVAFCEIDPFCQKALKKHWPNTPIIPDVRDVNAETIGEIIAKSTEQRLPTAFAGMQANAGKVKSSNRTIDLLTGGFPCQPFSHAGKRKGSGDNRHLWPEMFRVISELHPRWVIGENVRGLLTIENGVVFERCCLDLESIGYEVQPFVIPAAAVNAPHRRDRVWIVANSGQRFGGTGRLCRPGEDTETARSGASGVADEPDRHAADTDNTGLQKRQGENTSGAQPDSGSVIDRGIGSAWQEPWLEAATRLCTLDDGLSRGLVRPKGWRVNALKAAGNAIVPQVAAKIMEAIKAADNKERI